MPNDDRLFSSVRRVLVVGGGNAGWLVAAYLSATVGRSLGVSVSLVESPDIPAIGVGEATIPTLPETLAILGIDEGDFLGKVNGTFKQAIRFRDWLYDPAVRPTSFYHPFHLGDNHAEVMAADYLGRVPDAPPESYGRLVTQQVMACDLNKAPKGGGGEDLTYAYHLDAVLFGNLLRERFSGKGVHRFEGRVVGADRDGAGMLDAVVLESGDRLGADLFIDCSGFHGLLLQKTLEVPFDSFLDTLPCDRAMAVSAPHVDEHIIKPFTDSTARSGGWIWDVPLTHRRGVGYVYSSDFISDDEAQKELAAYLGVAGASEIEPRKLRMRVGCSRVLWRANCVGIGLAGGFLEPLESTGIYLIELGVKALVENWPDSGLTSLLVENYNRIMLDEYARIKDFLLMHYVTSERDDSEFWRYVTRADNMTASLKTRLDLWRYKMPSSMDVTHLQGQIFGAPSYRCILAGMGRLRGLATPYAAGSREGLMAHAKMVLEGYERYVRDLPGHRAYLAG